MAQSIKPSAVVLIAGSLLAGAILVAAAPGSAQQPPAIDAEALFTARCKSCHDPAIARAPSRADMRGRPHQEIVDALTRGVMQPMAVGMSPAEVDAVASLLTGQAA